MSTLVNETVTIQDYIDVAVNKHVVSVSDAVRERVAQCRAVLDELIEKREHAYGITAGFGALKDTVIDKSDLKDLQKNLLLSHAVGQGEPSPDHIVRGMFFHRLVSLSKGHSGVRVYLIDKIVEALNKNFIPCVPILGTVGASGDLAPLSHLFIGLMGHGSARDPDTGLFVPAQTVLKRLGIEPIESLEAKEGLALNNGTQFISAWTIFAYKKASDAYDDANMIAAMSVEALHGTHCAFDERIHAVRPHPGQIHAAKEMRDWLESSDSEIYKKYGSHVTQDAYSLRCIPQIHGVVYDNLEYVKGVLETELNSVTDNPLIFGHDILSGGNFHGQYIGNAADLITISMCLLCNISERRIDRLITGTSVVPRFLVKNSGLNSGFMIVQYAAAGITAEVRTMSAPGSIHSIPTCINVEDIVSMAGYSARKAYTAAERASQVLVNELVAACQALNFTPERPGPSLQEVHSRVRELMPFIETDQYMRDMIEAVRKNVMTSSSTE